MIVDISQWAVLWGALLPLLVGLATKYTTDAGLKAVLLLALNLLASVMEQFFASPDGFDWGGTLINAFAAFVIGVATHYGLWKPTKVSAGLQSVGARNSRRMPPAEEGRHADQP